MSRTHRRRRAGIVGRARARARGEAGYAVDMVRLTSHGFRMLTYLMHHRDHAVSLGELTEYIYAQDFDRDSDIVEIFVARLRRKRGASVIETVRGLGYRLDS